MTTGTYLEASGIMEMTLFDDGAFADFHKTQFHHCDGGLWLGDSSQTLVYSGKTMYMRGKRILDDTIEHLTQTTSLATATEVLITGRSGGGHAVFLVADYLSTLLPKTVTKIGAAPMSGFVNAY